MRSSGVSGSAALNDSQKVKISNFILHIKAELFHPFLAACSLLIPNSVWAWGGAGHQVIAAEAYRELSPELKAQVFDVLKAHPD
jgi:hypothetical protein